MHVAQNKYCAIMHAPILKQETGSEGHRCRHGLLGNAGRDKSCARYYATTEFKIKIIFCWRQQGLQYLAERNVRQKWFAACATIFALQHYAGHTHYGQNTMEFLCASHEITISTTLVRDTNAKFRIHNKSYSGISVGK